MQQFDPHSVAILFIAWLAQGFQKLQLLLKAILLRRTKGSTINGTPIINLPERRQELVKVNLSRDEAAFYKQVWSWLTVILFISIVEVKCEDMRCVALIPRLPITCSSQPTVIRAQATPIHLVCCAFPFAPFPCRLRLLPLLR